MRGSRRPSRDELAAGVALDALFRANAAVRPGALALVDPPDRARWAHDGPRRLTYAGTDAAVDRLARRFRSFGLNEGAVVAVQLPNIAEAVITLLAILRARLVAVPVPMLWRRSDLVEALGRVEAKALVTLTRFGNQRFDDIVRDVASELFSLSFPCAFGIGMPDGVIPLDLDEVAEGSGAGWTEPPVQSADAVAIATFDAAPGGYFAVGRSHSHWLAAGLAALLEARIGSGDSIVTTLPPASLAGIGGALVPWLLCGGVLELVQGLMPERFASAGNGARCHLLAPAAILPEVASNRAEPFASCLAVHRAPETLSFDATALRCETLVDLFSFGEIGSIALQRRPDGSACPIPFGSITAPSHTVSGPIVIETRLDADGALALGGAMVPKRPFPDSADGGRFPLSADGFVRTGYAARADTDGAFVIESQPQRIAIVGGLRFGLDDLRTRLARCVEGVKVEVVTDPLLGERLRIEADNPAAAKRALEAAGHSPLVIEAVEAEAEPRRAAG